jgi:hypothetical protein
MDRWAAGKGFRLIGAQAQLAYALMIG